MKKRKENMTPDYRKSGYLKVGRSVMRAFFTGERELQEMAKVLLCVETFAYFSEGQICLNDQVYFCHPGEWITSYTEMEELTGIDRRLVKKHLASLEKQHFVIVTDVGLYKLIALVNYEQSVQVQHTATAAASHTGGDDNPTGSGSSLWDMVNSFYSSDKRQEGGVN
ncbi:hypothetical protein [uncultured Parabacteroides sp.]|uniref:hypothetical protein n=1 Tax=uncultured Parabacteroides sp. TaxID=512312 RepID=UPI00259B6646|nr:hypothetical protein [uncultured Parabacteroides sp.]